MEADHVKKWRVGDIIDLEYFFYRDSVSQYAEDQQYLNERDRNIFLNSVRPGIKEGERPDRQYMIRTWLARRRDEISATDGVLPGDGYQSLYSSFRILFVIVGLVLGGGTGLSFLTYTGDRPLNVFVYLTVFVIFQVILLIILLALFLYRMKKGSFWSSSPLYRAIGRAMLRMLLSAKDRVSEKVGSEQRNRAESVLGIIVNKGHTYGALFFLPVFTLTQIFAIGFNLGLLGTTLFKVITADVAFGWQSTLQLSSAAVSTLVQKIALPWSWLVARDFAYPSLAQIEGSRIILKEGIYHLSTPALVSWWPFLCFSVLFYGLLPRLLLLAGAAVSQRRHLRGLDFRQGVYEQLLLRMATPLVSTHGRKVDASAPGEREAILDYVAKPQAAPNSRNLLVMVPDDIFTASSAEQIGSTVQHRFGSAVAGIVRINEDSETDAEILADLKDSSPPAENDILLIQEAWQPPILEYINFIKELRKAIGPGPCIRIGLIGKPQADTIFSAVKDENRKIWTQKINAIGDPCIFTVGLVNNVS
jgi:hypothetical protein